MKPILFNTEMVRVIQNGTKTVTRRVVKGLFDPSGRPPSQPYRPGDILYVRETWGDYSECRPGGVGYFLYRADYPDGAKTYEFDRHICDVPRWHPSIHMPREAARIFLRVTDVRVERLRDITGEQARKEGFANRGAFIREFLAMYPDCTLETWLWVIEFERISREEAMKSGS